MKKNDRARNISRQLIFMLFFGISLVACERDSGPADGGPGGLPEFCETKKDEIFKPSVNIIADPEDSKVPFEVTIRAEAQPGSEYTEIVKYQWDLNGDQIYDLETEDNEIFYEFLEPSQYTISVQAFDNCELTGVDVINVIARRNQPPVIQDFSSSPFSDGSAPFLVTLIARTYDPDGKIIRAEWDLDNDPEGVFEIITQASGPSQYYNFEFPYTFRKAGWYSVRVKVMDDNGATTVSAPLLIKVQLSIVNVFRRLYGASSANSVTVDLDEESNSATIYVTMGKGGISILSIPDLSNPSQVLLYGRIQTSVLGRAKNMEKYGDFLYLPTEDTGLMVYYVPSPYYSVYVGRLSYCTAEDVAVSEYNGKVFAFVACSFPPDLEVYDVTQYYDPEYPYEPALFAHTATTEFGGQPGEAVAVKWDPRGFVYVAVGRQGTVVYDFRNVTYMHGIPLIGLAPSLYSPTGLYRSFPVDIGYADYSDGRRYLSMADVWDQGMVPDNLYGCGEVVTYDVTDLESPEGSLFVFGEPLAPMYASGTTASAFLKYRFTAEKGNPWMPATLYKNGEKQPDSSYTLTKAREVVIGEYDPAATYSFDYIRRWLGRIYTQCWPGYWFPHEGITAVSDLVFVAGGTWGMQVIDNSDPSNPRQALPLKYYTNNRYDPNTKWTEEKVFEIEVCGDISFLADGGLGLTIIENRITGPAPYTVMPRLIRTYSTSGDPKSLHLRRPDLLLAIGRGGVDILDTSFPSIPGIIANIDSPGITVDVWETEGREYVFLADRNIPEYDPDPADEDALWIADRDYPSPFLPSLLTRWPDDPAALSDVKAVWGSGNRVYLLADRLYVLDITIPEEPYLLGWKSINMYDILAEGDFVFYLDSEGFKILDCRYPEAITVIGSFQPEGGKRLRGFDVEGEYAYVVDGQYLRVLDIGYPEAISEVAQIQVTQELDRVFNEVRVVNGYAFVGAGEESIKGGLVVADVRSLESIGLLGEILDYGVADIEAFREEIMYSYYAYTIDDEDTFYVYQVIGLE